MTKYKGPLGVVTMERATDHVFGFQFADGVSRDITPGAVLLTTDDDRIYLSSLNEFEANYTKVPRKTKPKPTPVAEPVAEKPKPAPKPRAGRKRKP